jgi:hypothetical protein
MKDRCRAGLFMSFVVVRKGSSPPPWPIDHKTTHLHPPAPSSPSLRLPIPIPFPESPPGNPQPLSLSFAIRPDFPPAPDAPTVPVPDPTAGEPLSRTSMAARVAASKTACKSRDKSVSEAALYKVNEDSTHIDALILQSASLEVRSSSYRQRDLLSLF